MYIPRAGFYSIGKYSRFTRKLLIFLVAMEGLEPPTRGFSVIFRGFEGFINQSLEASCRPLPRHTKAHQGTPRHNPGTLNLSWSVYGTRQMRPAIWLTDAGALAQDVVHCNT